MFDHDNIAPDGERQNVIMLRRIPPFFPHRYGMFTKSSLMANIALTISVVYGITELNICVMFLILLCENWFTGLKQMLPKSVQLYSTLLVVSLLASVSNVWTTSYSLVFIGVQTIWEQDCWSVPSMSWSQHPLETSWLSDTICWVMLRILYICVIIIW